MLKRSLITSFACVAFCAASLAPASKADVDFSGQTVQWVVPFGSGGGTAKWANFLAPFLSEELPGNPDVVVQFMPGGGGIKGANWFQTQRHTDGTLMFAASGSNHFPFILGDSRVRYSYDDWVPVMASGTGGVAYLNAQDGAAFDGTAAPIQDATFTYASQGAARLDLVPLLAWRMLDLEVDAIFGVQSRGEGRQKFVQGEANIDYQTSSSYLNGSFALVAQGRAVPMMSWGVLDDAGNVVRDPNFPNMATFKEVCMATRACDLSSDAWEAWKAFFVAGFVAQKVAFLPKGTPEDVADAYRDAFQAVLARPDFRDNAFERIGNYQIFVGKDAERALSIGTTVSDDARSFVSSWLETSFGVRLYTPSTSN